MPQKFVNKLFDLHPNQDQEFLSSRLHLPNTLHNKTSRGAKASLGIRPLAQLIHHPGLFNNIFNFAASKQLQSERISIPAAKAAVLMRTFPKKITASPNSASIMKRGHTTSSNVNVFLRASNPKFLGFLRRSLQKQIRRSFTAGMAKSQSSRP